MQAMSTERTFTEGNDKDYNNVYDENYLYLLGGNDAITGVNASFVFMYGGAGKDDIVYAASGVATLYGGKGSDDLDNGTGAAVCYLYGGAGGDRLDTDRSTGDSFLYGGSGSDGFWGGAGNETMYGGSGGDDITGRLGADHLYGGGGRDFFVYESALDSLRGEGNRDTIHQFKHGDVIDLQGIDANSTKRGAQAFVFIRKEGFHGEAGELRFKKGLLQGDTNGDGVADFEVHVTGANVTGADLYL
jgi:Ca2+-binding RTX toxin-like protein